MGSSPVTHIGQCTLVVKDVESRYYIILANDCKPIEKKRKERAPYFELNKGVDDADEHGHHMMDSLWSTARQNDHMES